MNNDATIPSRVIGFDSHPDSFTAAMLRGPTPAAAITERIFNQVPMSQLTKWATKNTNPDDLIVLEASGNSFEVVRTLEAINRKAKVLESVQMGKLKEAHANNDKISAVRIGKAYLAGTAKEVWVPDLVTQDRRNWFHAYMKAVKRTTQLINRLKSFLSDNGVRVNARIPLGKQQKAAQAAKDWSPRQLQVIEGMFMELRHAEEQRAHWSSLMAQEVIASPLMLSMVRLCGVRDVIAFTLGALIGDINRFASPKKLVSYVGLNPAFDASGNNRWEGGVGGHGRRDLRGLLIESAQAIMRTNHPLAKWGKKLLARKGAYKLAVAAVARKLTVAIWYLMMGRWTVLEELDSLLSAKVGKIVTKVGTSGLEKLGKTRKELRKEVCESLRNGRTYVLRTDRQFQPKPPPEPERSRTTSLAEEYGLV